MKLSNLQVHPCRDFDNKKRDRLGKLMYKFMFRIWIIEGVESVDIFSDHFFDCFVTEQENRKKTIKDKEFCNAISSELMFLTLKNN